MQIIENRRDNKVELEVSGRLDANTSEQLEKEIKNFLSYAAVKRLYLDFSKVEYISSAAIRVLLAAQKSIKEGHELIIVNPSEFCTQVFQVTGADIFLDIERLEK